MKTITFDETRWKLVPVESTPEMEWSWNRADVTFTDGTGRRLPHDPHSAWKSRYAAMLAATPAAPELQALIVAHTTQSQESAAPQGEPLGYINAGHLHEIQSGRVPYVYVYAGPSVGAEVPVYTTPAAQSQLTLTLTDERLREIDDAHNWQTTEGRMAAYKTIIADLKANVIKARSKE